MGELPNSDSEQDASAQQVSVEVVVGELLNSNSEQDASVQQVRLALRRPVERDVYSQTQNSLPSPCQVTLLLPDRRPALHPVHREYC